LFLLLLLIFLVPVAAYCLILAMVNRRLHPVMLSGPWDMAGLLFAVSGGVLFVGPAIIAMLYHRSLDDVPLAGRATPSFGDVWAPWWRIWLVYYVLVIGGSVALLWHRRRTTIIYNVSPGDFDRTLALLLDRLGLDWNRLGNRIFVGAGRDASPPAPELQPFTGDPLVVAPEGAVTLPPRPVGEAVFDIEPFGTLCHVTLHWRRHTGLIREELEAELSRVLAQAHAPDNPAGTWFLAVSGFLLAVIFLGIFVIVLNTFFPLRR
jgi:hypothetical protein